MTDGLGDVDKVVVTRGTDLEAVKYPPAALIANSALGARSPNAARPHRPAGVDEPSTKRARWASAP